MKSDVVEDIESLVSDFSQELQKKLLRAEIKYNWQGGWKQKDWEEKLQQDLLEHIKKGDPLDVAAYCAFAWYHG